MAILEAADKLAIESVALTSADKSEIAQTFGVNLKYKTDHELHLILHQYIIASAFTAGYSKAREQMNSK